MKNLFALLVVLIVLCGCLEAGEKIIGESIRKDAFIDKKLRPVRDEIIVEPNETLYARINVTERSAYRFIGESGDAANFTIVLHHPDGHEKNFDKQGGINGFIAPFSPVSGTGTFEISVINNRDKPAYLWYTLYVCPPFIDGGEVKRADAGTSSEVTYLTFQK